MYYSLRVLFLIIFWLARLFNKAKVSSSKLYNLSSRFSVLITVFYGIFMMPCLLIVTGELLFNDFYETVEVKLLR